MTSYGGHRSSPSGSGCAPYRRARKGATSATSRFWGSRATTIPNVEHRALVVGAGNAGKAHAEALASLGIEVVGPLSGTATVADFAPLRDPAVDVVHVTTANDLHPPLVLEALRAEKHVVCEKPLAGDLFEIG